jgi:hypothetical protein
MSKSVQSAPPRSVPEAGSGSVQAGALFSVPAVADEHTIESFIDRGYALTRDAVALWGGPIALASLLDTAFSTVSERLNRKEVKGALQRAFIDYLFIALTHPQAGESFLFGLCDLLGFEHPKRRRLKTDVEKYEALVKQLRGMGELGEHAIRVTAAAIGADPSEFDR